jgi:hypothetical protein
MNVLWWVGFTIACILTFLYLIGVYFTYFDDPDEFKKNFSNDKRYLFAENYSK